MDKKVNGVSLDSKALVADTLYDASEFKPYDATQDVVFPPEIRVN